MTGRLALPFPGLASAARIALVPYLASRAVLFAVAWAAAAWFGTARAHDPHYPAPFQAWLAWDAAHYLRIAAAGYPADPRAVENGYFPLLPAVLHLAGGGVAAALVLAFALGFAALVALTALTSELFGPRTARRTAWVACWAPETFVLSAVYTEAPFLLAIVGALWASWRGRLVVAVPLGVAAALLRPNGFVIALPMLVLLPAGRARLAAAAPVAASGAFALYEWVVTGTPFAYLLSQQAHHPVHAGMLAVFRATARPDERLGLASLVLALVLAVLLAFRVLGARGLGRWRVASVLLVAGLLLPSLCSGTLASFGRYALVAFPLLWAASTLRLSRVAPFAIPAAALVTAGCAIGRLTP